MIRVGVIGAAGRMGATVCNAVVADPGLELVAVVDSGAPGSTTHGLTISGELRALADAKVIAALAGATPTKIVIVPKRLINFVI